MYVDDEMKVTMPTAANVQKHRPASHCVKIEVNAQSGTSRPTGLGRSDSMPSLRDTVIIKLL